jgi:hypothetical protein
LGSPYRQKALLGAKKQRTTKSGKKETKARPPSFRERARLASNQLMSQTAPRPGALMSTLISQFATITHITARLSHKLLLAHMRPVAASYILNSSTYILESDKNSLPFT